MAYSFGAVVTDKIICGADDSVTKASTFSVAVRLRPNSADASRRSLIIYDTLVGYQVYLDFDAGGTNRVEFGFSKTVGTVFPLVTWVSGFAAASLHTLVGTYDLSNIKLYADTDATAKATLAETGTPDNLVNSQFWIGNDRGATTRSANSLIYEVAWWAGTALTGAQSAIFGAGYDARLLTPYPSSHWQLIGNAIDAVGANHGTVTGATVVAHGAPIIYPAPRTTRRFTTAVASTSRSFGYAFS